MLDLSLKRHASGRIRVLCLGAHCDDIEIGCGATLHRLQASLSPASIDWVIFSGGADRRAEAEASMGRLVQPASRGRLIFGEFADACFPADYRGLKDFMERLRVWDPPDVILCHERDDRHQDHRIVNEMVWSTFRNHLVLEYEVPKWDGGLGQPNVYVPVDQVDVDAKVGALMTSYATQRSRDWFSPQTFLSLLRLRGLECRSPSGYAEAFHGRKLQLLVD